MKWLTLHGFTFRQTLRTFMETKEPLLRSDWTIYRGGAVFFDGSEDCALADCFLDQVGGNAVFVNNYNRRLTIRGCRIDKSGAGGVMFVGDPKAVRSPLFEYGQRQPLDQIDRTSGPADRQLSGRLPRGRLPDHAGRPRRKAIDRRGHRRCVPASRSAIAASTTCRAPASTSATAAGAATSSNSATSSTRSRKPATTARSIPGAATATGCRTFRRSTKYVAANPDLPLLDAVEPTTLRNNRWRCDHGWDIDLDDGSTNYHIYNNLCLHGGIKNREGFTASSRTTSW